MLFADQSMRSVARGLTRSSPGPATSVPGHVIYRIPRRTYNSLNKTSKKQEHHLDNTDSAKPIPNFAFVFDIDGVLVRGKKVLPKAKEALEQLNSTGVPFLLLTNGGGKSEKTRAKDLETELQVPIDADMIVQSHSPFSDMELYKKGCALIVGGKRDNCAAVADGYGFKNVLTPNNIFRSEKRIWPLSSLAKDCDNTAKVWKMSYPIPSIEKQELKIDSIFVYNDPVDWGLDLVLITDCLLSERGVLGTLSKKNGDPKLPNRGYQQDGQPPLFFSNDDLWYAAQFTLPRLGQGGFRAAVEGVWAAITGGAANGVELKKTIIGKPHQGTYDFAEKKLETLRKQRFGEVETLRPLKRVYMIGDNPESDIRGATNYRSPLGTRWASALLRTGVYSGGTPSVQPTVILDNVQDAVTWGLQQSNWHDR